MWNYDLRVCRYTAIRQAYCSELRIGMAGVAAHAVGVAGRFRRKHQQQHETHHQWKLVTRELWSGLLHKSATRTTSRACVVYAALCGALAIVCRR